MRHGSSDQRPGSVAGRALLGVAAAAAASPVRWPPPAHAAAGPCRRLDGRARRQVAAAADGRLAHRRGAVAAHRSTRSATSSGSSTSCRPTTRLAQLDRRGRHRRGDRLRRGRRPPRPGRPGAARHRPGRPRTATAGTDPVGHGTTVAGLIAGRSDDDRGVVGLAPDAKILPVRVLDEENRYDDALIVAKGVRWAVDNGARVINLSLGGSGDSPALAAALDYAFARDVVVVACTGNLATSTHHQGLVPGPRAGRDRGGRPGTRQRQRSGPARSPARQTVLTAPATGLVGARPRRLLAGAGHQLRRAAGRRRPPRWSGPASRRCPPATWSTG